MKRAKRFIRRVIRGIKRRVSKGLIIPRYRTTVLACALFHVVLLAASVVLAVEGDLDWAAPVVLLALLPAYVVLLASVHARRQTGDDMGRSAGRSLQGVQREIAALRSFLDATSGPTLREWDLANKELAAAIASIDEGLGAANVGFVPTKDRQG